MAKFEDIVSEEETILETKIMNFSKNSSAVLAKRIGLNAKSYKNKQNQNSTNYWQKIRSQHEKKQAHYQQILYK